MTNTNNVIIVNRVLLIRMLIGAGIALAVILTFVLGVDEPNPTWHRTWWIRPIVITPLAGAGGGIFFHFMSELGKAGTWKKNCGKPDWHYRIRSGPLDGYCTRASRHHVELTVVQTGWLVPV